jgi:hemolysin III
MRVIVTEERPRLRGIPDVVALFVLVPISLWLIASARDELRWAAIVYSVGLLGLFSVSACYHALTWSSRGLFWWKRADHSMIYVLIAGSYTPPAIRILDPDQATLVLSLVWGGALLGALKAVFWHRAPRALTVGFYLLLGWSIVPYWETALERMSPWAIGYFAGGGLLYSMGALVYATRWPNPWPRTFGYHEVMHLFVITAALAQFGAQWLLLT